MVQMKESYQGQISLSRGSHRSGDRGEFNNLQQIGFDGWIFAGKGSGPPRADNLSNFGKISKTLSMTFVPSSVFAGKKAPTHGRIRV